MISMTRKSVPAKVQVTCVVVCSLGTLASLRFAGTHSETWRKEEEVIGSFAVYIVGSTVVEATWMLPYSPDQRNSRQFLLRADPNFILAPWFFHNHPQSFFVIAIFALDTNRSRHVESLLSPEVSPEFLLNLGALPGFEQGMILIICQLRVNNYVFITRFA